ncbi:MAG: hypothetical protein Fur0025_22080 [Oscillatoriaceae cyanobacterium]
MKITVKLNIWRASLCFFLVGAAIFIREVATAAPKTTIFIGQADVTTGDRLTFINPPNAKDDEPENREADNKFGGDACETVNIPLTAIVPGEMDKSMRAFTAQANPTLWFYVPYQEKAARLSLISKATGYRIFEENYQLNGTPGIIGITLSDISLEEGQDYRWVFEIICNPEDSSANMSVSGKIQRISFNQPANFSELTAEQRAFIYAKNGLWSETMNTIIQELRPLDREQSTRRLKELLQSVGLEKIDPEQISPCCTPNQQP